MIKGALILAVGFLAGYSKAQAEDETTREEIGNLIAEVRNALRPPSQIEDAEVVN